MPEPEKKKKSQWWQPWSPEYIGLLSGVKPRSPELPSQIQIPNHPFKWLGMYPDTKFKEYLIRLNEYLELQKATGNITQSQVDLAWSNMGQTISANWKDVAPWFTLKQDAKYGTDTEWQADFDKIAADIGLETPFWDETVGSEFEWQTSINPLRKNAIKTGYQLEATRNDYLPRLQNALGAARSRGEMTYADAQDAYAEAEEAINAGVTGKNLPYSQQVEAWESFMESEVKRTETETGVARTKYETEQKANQLQRLDISESQHEVARGILERRGALRTEARQYEQARQEALPQLNAPMDWITKWQVEHGLSPYGGRDISPYGYLTERVMERGIPQPDIPSIVQQFAPGVTPAYSGFMGRPQYEQAIKEPLTKVPITTPSGQALGRMRPSEIEALQGYAQYAGQYWPDILSKTARMLPQPLRGSSWRSARQGG